MLNQIHIYTFQEGKTVINLPQKKPSSKIKLDEGFLLYTQKLQQYQINQLLALHEQLIQLTSIPPTPNSQTQKTPLKEELQ